MNMHQILTRADYTVAWLCALAKSELVAASAMLDTTHRPLPLPPEDDNTYRFGSINGHNVVIACMPPGVPGKVSATKLLQPLRGSFPNLKSHLFVGIGGGVPQRPIPSDPNDDIHLGDVVVGWAEETGAHAVVQWDFRRRGEDNKIELLGWLDKPDRHLLNALTQLLADRVENNSKFAEHLERLTSRRDFSHPGIENDRLYNSTYCHVGDATASTCDGCDNQQVVCRPPRKDESFVFHQGTILSGDSVMQNAKERDGISKQFPGAKCFEMEAAGVMDEKRCLVIRGIADYSDSHKNGSWQNYAAATAAAFAREFLYNLPLHEAPQPQSQVHAEDEDIMEWLSPCKFKVRQSDYINSCFPDVGKWFLDHEVFKLWAAGSQSWYLRCYGEQGSGKTMLSSMVIDHLQEAQDKTKPPKQIIYLLLDENDSTTYTPAHLLGSLLKQLIQLNPSTGILTELQSLYRETKPRTTKSWKSILRLLEDQISHCDRVYIIADGLDTFLRKSCEDFNLEAKLSQLQQNLSAKMALLIMTRKSIQTDVGPIICDDCGAEERYVFSYCDICNSGEFDLCRGCTHKGIKCMDKSHKMKENPAVVLEIRTKNEDLELYIRDRIKREIERTVSPTSLVGRIYPKRSAAAAFRQLCLEQSDRKEVIISVIAEKAEGKILFAKLFVDELKQCKNDKEIYAALYDFPKDLDSKYEAAMKRIQTQPSIHKERALKVMSRLTSAYRTLTFAELRHLLATYPGDTKFNQGNSYSREDVLEVIDDLVSISEHDQNAVVQVLHFSLYEYLDKNHCMWFPKAKVDMAHACLTYLNFDVFSKPCEDIIEFNQRKHDYPFIVYASQYWGHHVRDTMHDPDIEERTVAFLDETLRMSASIQAVWSTESWGLDTWDVCMGFDKLHVCAWFGLSSVMSAFERREKNLHIDIGDMTYQQTPLMCACRRGNIDMVRHLLERGADVNRIDTRGHTPMFEAIVQNQEKVVKLLLNREELNINKAFTNKHDRTALMLAAFQGQSSVIRSLLKRDDIDINKQDKDGHTAIYLATEAGYIETVNVLLNDTRIDLDLVNRYGYSALCLAAMNNHHEIVEQLLKKSADSSLKDKQGGTALLRAIDYECVDVVKLMLEDKSVYSQCLDYRGRGIVHKASFTGNPEIMELLMLDEYGLDLDKQDKDGLTPLHCGCAAGHLEVVQTLLAYRADKDIRDQNGWTPSTMALFYGQMRIAGTLNGENTSEPVDPPTVDMGMSPVWSLVQLGRQDLMLQAIVAGKHNLSEKEPINHYTALHLVVLNDKIDVLQMLLKDTGLDPNPINVDQRTPLHLAAINGKLEAVNILLLHNARVDLKDLWGDTPLVLAECYESIIVALTLIEAGADTQKINVQNMFFSAVRHSRIAATQILLKKGADPLAQDVTGKRAIKIAEDAKNDKMVQILQSSETFKYMEGDGKPKQSHRGIRPTKHARNDDETYESSKRCMTTAIACVTTRSAFSRASSKYWLAYLLGLRPVY